MSGSGASGAPGAPGGAAASGGADVDELIEELEEDTGDTAVAKKDVLHGLLQATTKVIMNDLKAKQFIDNVQDEVFMRNHDMKRFLYMIPFILVAFTIWSMQMQPHLGYENESQLRGLLEGPDDIDLQSNDALYDWLEGLVRRIYRDEDWYHAADVPVYGNSSTDRHGIVCRSLKLVSTLQLWLTRKKEKPCDAHGDSYGKCYEPAEYPIESCIGGRPAGEHYATIMSSEPYGPVSNKTMFKPDKSYPVFFSYQIPLENTRLADALAIVKHLKDNNFLDYDTYTFEVGIPTFQASSGMGVQAWMRFTFPNTSPGEYGLYSWSGRIFYYDKPGDNWRIVLEIIYALFALRLISEELWEWGKDCRRASKKNGKCTSCGRHFRKDPFNLVELVHGVLFIISIFFWMHIAEGFTGKEGTPMFSSNGGCSDPFAGDWTTGTRARTRDALVNNGRETSFYAFYLVLRQYRMVIVCIISLFIIRLVKAVTFLPRFQFFFDLLAGSAVKVLDTFVIWLIFFIMLIAMFMFTVGHTVKEVSTWTNGVMAMIEFTFGTEGAMSSGDFFDGVFTATSQAHTGNSESEKFEVVVVGAMYFFTVVFLMVIISNLFITILVESYLSTAAQAKVKDSRASLRAQKQIEGQKEMTLIYEIWTFAKHAFFSFFFCCTRSIQEVISPEAVVPHDGDTRDGDTEAEREVDQEDDISAVRKLLESQRQRTTAEVAESLFDSLDENHNSFDHMPTEARVHMLGDQMYHLNVGMKKMSETLHDIVTILSD